MPPYFSAFPWLRDHAPKHLIIGDDLDAALSALLYLRHNPNAVLAGVYCGYQRLCYHSGLAPNALAQAIYLDLDIAHAQCRSLGHHILRVGAGDQLAGLANSCNPNQWIGRSIEQGFAQKYPLGTVHLLLALYNEDMPNIPYAEATIWLADSAFINGQSHRFRANMHEWLYQHLPHAPLQQGFERIDTVAFEEKIAQTQSFLQEKGFVQGRGQVQSRHLHLTGFQCQPDAHNMPVEQVGSYFRHLLAVLAEVTGWHWAEGQIQLDALRAVTGKRTSLPLAQVAAQGGLDDFLAKNDVFSYAFPYKNSINYTTFAHK